MGIRVSTELDPSGMKKGATTVKRTLADVDKTASKTEKGFAGLSKSAMATGVAMATTAVAIAAVTSQLKKSISIQRNFEKSMADLAAITGATGDDLKFLNEEAKKLGSTTTFSASQVATSFKLIASAKPDLLESADALAEVTASVLLLAEASGSELTAAASTVGSALNQFGAGAEEAARFVNVLAAGAKLGASEVEDTAMALKNAGIAASSAGLSFEEFNATVQVLASAGLKGSEAGTSLRTIFSKLETDIDENVRPSVVGLSKALENLAARELDTTGLVKTFGEEHKDAARFVLDNRTEVDKLTDSLTGTNVATEQAAIKMNTLDGDMKALTSATEGLYINIGTLLNPAARASTQALTDLATATSFYFASLQKGSTEKLLSDMTRVEESIALNEEALANYGSSWDEFAFRISTAGVLPDDAESAKARLVELRAELKNLRDDYNNQTGLARPFTNVPGVGPTGPIQPVTPLPTQPLTPTTGGTSPLTDESVTNTARDLKTLNDLQQQLAVSTAETSRESAQLVASFRLSSDATDLQIAKVNELSGALFDQKQQIIDTAKAESDAAALTSQVEQIAFGALSPVDQLRAEEQLKLDVLNEFALLGADQAKQAEDLKTAVAEKGASDRKELARLEQRTTLSAASSGFDALSSLAGAFATGQDAENSKAFALSKAFAIASAGLNLSLAISQALADPTALTLPQKLSNYAVIGTAGAGLVNSIASASYATGGFVQGAGSGTSDSINANISSGEFVMNARATSRNRGPLESLNNGGSLERSNSTVVNVINNTPSEVTTSTASNGDLTVQIDERINRQVPGLIGSELNNPNSKGTKAIRSNYNIPRK